MTNTQLWLALGFPTLVVLVGILLNWKGFDTLRQQIDDVRGEIKDVRGEVRDVRGEVKDVRGEVGGLRGEVKDVRGEVGGLRGEVKDVRGEVGGLRGEVRDLRSEMLAGFARIDARLERVDADLRTFYSITGNLQGRLDELSKS